MTVRFHEAAAREYLAAQRWYQARGQHLVTRFRDEMDQAIQNLVALPDSGILYRKGFRWVRLRKFPYLLFYRHAHEHLVEIMAVSHTRRRPGYWLRRKTQS